MQAFIDHGETPLSLINQGATTASFIGVNYGGGIIFYIENDGTGLVAAPTNQSEGTAWGCFGTAITGADGTAIGTGNQNTIDIVAGCTTADIAADICANLNLNGYTDWYLPSKDELYELYVNIGSGVDFFYWTSTEYDNDKAWAQSMAGAQNLGLKTSPLKLRAIRAF